MFSTDKVICLIILVVAVRIGTFYYPRKWFVVHANPGSETRFIAFVHVLQLLQVAIAILFLIGIVGMAVRVKTSLWIFWQAFYLPSVEMVFVACPALTVVAVFWGTAGWLRLEFGRQSIGVIAMLVLTATVNFGLYFTLDWIFANMEWE